MKKEAPEGVPRTISIKTAQAQMEAVGLEPAVDLTIIAWIKKYDLGSKVAGKWLLREEDWHAFLRGERKEVE